MLEQNTTHNTSGEGLAVSDSWIPTDVSELPVDVYRNGSKIYIIATIAGVAPEDLDIAIEKNTVVVKGDRRRPYDPVINPPFKEECVWGAFYKELIISEDLDIDGVVANIDRGILVLIIPILGGENLL